MDASMRSQYSNQWVLPASHLVNGQFQQEVAQYAGNLSHAQKSDAIVSSKLSSIQQTLQKISGTDVSTLSPFPFLLLHLILVQGGHLLPASCGRGAKHCDSAVDGGLEEGFSFA